MGFGDPWSASPRTYLEVYPHPALIEAFGLDERLPYKKGRVQERRSGLRELERLISTLRTRDVPLVADRIAVTDNVRGTALKEIEDVLDARVCAWVAATWTRFGTARIRLFGDRSHGHIAVPAPI